MATKKPLGLYAGEVEGFAVGDFVDIANGGTGAITKTAAFNNLSPTTTRGDIVINDGGGNARLGVGENGMVLTADNQTPNGIRWATPASGSSGTALRGMVKGDGTNLVLAVPDVDYPSVETVEFIEYGYKLGDKKIQEKLDEYQDKLLTENRAANSFLFNNTSNVLQWVGGVPITYLEVFPGKYDSPREFLENKGLISTVITENFGELNSAYLNIKTNGFYGMLKAVAEVGPDSNGIIGGVIQQAVAGVDFALPSTSVPPGGFINQVLAKSSNVDNDLKWTTPSGGTGVSVFSVNLKLGFDIDLGIYYPKTTHTHVFTNTDELNRIMYGKTFPVHPDVNYIIANIGFYPTSNFDQMLLDQSFDELELNPLICYAYVSSVNEITLKVTSSLGVPFSGSQYINFFIG